LFSAILLYVMIRFHHTRNPVPSRTSHNAVIEFLWTVIPVLILVVIAIPLVQADVLHGRRAER